MTNKVGIVNPVGEQQTASFYDERLDRVSRPLEQSPWLSVYAATADLLPAPSSGAAIADLGCGTGRLAKLLRQQGHTKYWGCDFSGTRIQEARKYVPDCEFTVGDLFAVEVQQRFADYDAFVALEILEHVWDDLMLISAIPFGATVVFSVPTYDSAGHVRTFDTPQAAHSRYSELLAFDPNDCAILPRRRSDKKIFVIRGTRH